MKGTLAAALKKLRLSGLLLKKDDANAAAGCLVRVAHLYDEVIASFRVL